jgi:hypothetical protein
MAEKTAADTFDNDALGDEALDEQRGGKYGPTCFYPSKR